MVPDNTILRALEKAVEIYFLCRKILSICVVDFTASRSSSKLNFGGYFFSKRFN